jgi:hypothetical protein
MAEMKICPYRKGLLICEGLEHIIQGRNLEINVKESVSACDFGPPAVLSSIE